jgi:hypothetical protein
MKMLCRVVLATVTFLLSLWSNGFMLVVWCFGVRSLLLLYGVLDQSADGRVVQVEMSGDFNLAVAMLVNRVGDQLIALGCLFSGFIKEPFQSRSSEKPLLLGNLFDRVFAGYMIR